MDDPDLIERLRYEGKTYGLWPERIQKLLREAAGEIARLRQIPVQVASICVEHTELVPSDMPFPAALEVVLTRYETALDLLRQIVAPDEDTPYREIRELLAEVGR